MLCLAQCLAHRKTPRNVNTTTVIAEAADNIIPSWPGWAGCPSPRCCSGLVPLPFLRWCWWQRSFCLQNVLPPPLNSKQGTTHAPLHLYTWCATQQVLWKLFFQERPHQISSRCSLLSELTSRSSSGSLVIPVPPTLPASLPTCLPGHHTVHAWGVRSCSCLSQATHISKLVRS